jgi:C4-dicarboxylate-specific signal transduction histidine kinase
MRIRFFPGFFLRPQALAVSLACLLAFVCSCGPKEPRLSPAAQKFKSEILNELKAVSAALMQPVVERNVDAMNKALAEGFLKAEKAGAPLPAAMAVIDPNGFVLARYPAANGSGEQFSDYQVFKEVMKTKRIGKQVLYRADGSRNYVILAPLLSESNLVGFFAIVFRAAELQDNWQVSGQEFMVIDFNK